MGIEWYNHYCPERPSAPHSHWWIEVKRVDKGSVFACKFCIRVQWWPNEMSGGQNLGKLMKLYGQTEGYLMMLDENPKARRLVARLQDLHYIRNAIPDEELRAQVIVTLLNAKDSDYPANLDGVADWQEGKIELPKLV